MFLNIMLIGHTKTCGSMLFCGSIVTLGQCTHAAMVQLFLSHSSISLASWLALCICFLIGPFKLCWVSHNIVMKLLGI